MLAGRYLVEGRAGRGGMGQVYRGRDLRLERPVALKTPLLPGRTAEERARSRREFLREARLLAVLDHPNLAPVLDCFEDAGRPWLVSAWVEGRDLESVARTHPGPLDPARVVDWAEGIAAALDYLHSRRPPVLFLDLKPANVMLESGGNLRLVDFGVARRQARPGATTSLLAGLGTPGFAPLEQYAGRPEPRSDLYAMGATLVALLARCPPPEATARAAGSEDLPPLPPEVPAGLERALRRLLALRPEERPASAAAALTDLRAGLRARDPRSVPVVLCPFRDGLGPPPASADQAPADPPARPREEPVLPWVCTVAFQGPAEVARRRAEAAARHGLRARALPGDPGFGLGPTPWIVLVSPPAP